MGKVRTLIGFLTLVVAVQCQWPLRDSARRVVRPTASPGNRNQMAALQQLLMPLLSNLMSPNPPGGSPGGGSQLAGMYGAGTNGILSQMAGASGSSSLGVGGGSPLAGMYAAGNNGLLSQLTGASGSPALGIGGGSSAIQTQILRSLELCERQCPRFTTFVCADTGSTYDNMCRLNCTGERFMCHGECPCTMEKMLMREAFGLPSALGGIASPMFPSPKPDPQPNLQQLLQQFQSQRSTPSRNSILPTNMPRTTAQPKPIRTRSRLRKPGQKQRRQSLQMRQTIRKQQIGQQSLSRPTSQRKPKQPRRQQRQQRRQRVSASRQRPQSRPQARHQSRAWSRTLPQPRSPILKQMTQMAPRYPSQQPMANYARCVLMCNPGESEPVCTITGQERANQCLATCL